MLISTWWVLVDESSLGRKFAALWPHLNERQRRLLLGAKARELGYGGVAAVARAVDVSVPTVRKGIRELDAEVVVEDQPERVR